ncbi:enhanced intracellular survival protein Eis [Myceligenerans pegani]|uniref:GNAT family N-acetyltransferase n=1 Tax=Myceligenerans pegani TaxID=2776917 RepID=A0ABR9MT29_9MICO|nr:GNAT family N-acetyltransferase [Myceligenerans sp. TRM 65318]MBE1874534.1 GNAT family N-acetyltransferase [Myceligenerans sp. TRM 65318]MBE3016805.1 GNAT family N-acetyltransferase [Myceligenerans sp. TRM 65318]
MHTSTLPDVPLPDGYRFRALAEADLRAVRDLDLWAFPSATALDEAVQHSFPLGWDRAIGIEAEGFDGLAALHGSYPFRRFGVPGGTLPTGGLTWVGVHPQHRRRGLLTGMIDLHLARCRERGEPLSALFAAEAPIYGRFGYGKAADDVRLTIARGAGLHEVPGADEHTVRIAHASREQHGDLVGRLHRAAGERPTGVAGINRPGWCERETEELQAHFWADLPAFRGGRESRRIVVVERGGEPRGYALFRRKLDWETFGPRGTTAVSEAVALDAAAARALWGVLVDFDLTVETSTFLLPVDDAVTRLLMNPRAAQPRVVDNVWVRLVDVAGALAGRQYAADVDVRIAVTDARLPENAGTYRLRARVFGEATCDRVAEPADLSLDVRELGAAYLGGTSLAALAAAGLVTEHTPGALATAAAAFGWPVAPMSSWVW